MFIYVITNIINSEQYIGCTVDFEQRKKRHLSNSKKHDTYLYRAMRKYGVENFIFEVIDECITMEKMYESEKLWINKLDTFKNGYNMTVGGTGGDTSNSENYIKGMKNRDINGKNNPMYDKPSAMKGKKHSNETKEKMSTKRKKYWTDDNRKIQSDKMKGKNNFRYGKMPPNALKLRIRGRIFNSIAEASRELNISIYYIKKEAEYL